MTENKRPLTDSNLVIGWMCGFLGRSAVAPEVYEILGFVLPSIAVSWIVFYCWKAWRNDW